MGYTHYVYRPKILEKEKWNLFKNDVQKIVDYCQNKLGIALANGLGEPGTQPEITDDFISFNGSDAQPVGIWTTRETISIPWPTETASIEEPAESQTNQVAGYWYGGTLVTQRVAPISEKTGLGLGSYETLYIERVIEDENYFPNKLYLDFCKTAYRPYDLAVTAVLISLKYHFDNIFLESDGKEKDWLDGRILCNNLFGYGLEMNLFQKS